MNIYQQIVTDMIQAIENQQFKRGQKLPSIRRLSHIYHCSKETVHKAMQELKYLNRIYAVNKSGYYVLEDAANPDQTLDIHSEDSLPYEDFRLCLQESLIGRERYLFNYYHQQEGLEELLISLQQLLMNYHVYCKKEQVVITSGSQQALYILSQLDFGEGKSHILIEEPTYSRMTHLLIQQDIPYLTIERTLQGIDLVQLETLFQTGKIRFFYTIPRLHNPLGASYDRETKQKLVQLAQKYQVYLVEDDYMADFDKEKAPPLHYLDQDQKVIYIKSFTPTLFPALRIGGLVLPQELVPRFLQHKSLIDYDTNLIMQKALSLYIDNGMFRRNTLHLVNNYQMDSQQLLSQLQNWNACYPYAVAGQQVTFQVSKTEKTRKLFEQSLGFQIIEGSNYLYLQTSLADVVTERLAALSSFLEEHM